MSVLVDRRAAAPPAGAAEQTRQRLSARRRRERGTRLEWIIIHLLYLVIVVFFFSPFLWLLTAAFDGKAVAYIRWPAQPTFGNFTYVFGHLHIGRSLANSLFISTATMVRIVRTRKRLSLRPDELPRQRFGVLRG